MPNPLLQFDRDASHQLELGLAREWLEADGLGGYASSTILMCPTRRYHGLLVTPPHGNRHRHVFLARFEETVHARGVHFPLSIARYAPGRWAPHGHKSIESFNLVPYPSFRYRIGSVQIVREVLLVRGQPTVLCRYSVSGQDEPLELQLRPLLPFRDADALTHENPWLDTRTARFPGGIRLRPYDGLPALAMTLSAADAHFEADPVWYRNIEYIADLARGYDGHEDNYCPGVFHVPCVEGADIVVAATIGEPVADPAALWADESARRSARVGSTPKSVHAVLALAADDFLYRAPDGRDGVIAGFPWFGEWGRDTFIALPGLTLTRGDRDGCRSVLVGALPFLRRGLMPNVFGTSADDSHYNSIDAALWFARAVQLYHEAGAPDAEVRSAFLPALVEIATRYRDGTDLGIGTDADGLLFAGGPDVNGTWMDAQTAAGPVTPRHGYAVELNGLWFAFLRYLARQLSASGDEGAARTWDDLADRAAAAFVARFWQPNDDFLADRWVDGAPDRCLRPNAVIAAALADSPLSQEMRVCVVRTAEAELLTPRGLRTLAPECPGYIGRYAGSPEDRDRAYHMGTAWPWLLGFYVEASLRAFGGDSKHVADLRRLLDGLADQLKVAGLDHVSEVFDGDAPHRAGGTIAQAWNTGEILRAYRLLEEWSI